MISGTAAATELLSFCSCYRAVKLLQHGKKVVERVLEKKPCRIVSVDEMQFGFLPESGTIDAVFI